jgi:hypothetical protein
MGWGFGVTSGICSICLSPNEQLDRYYVLRVFFTI